MSDTSYFAAFKWVYSHLQSFRKKQFWLLLAAMFIVALFETGSLGTIAFFSSAVTDPENVKSSKYVGVIKQFVDAEFLNSSKGLIYSSGLLMCFLMMVKNVLKALSKYGMARFSAAMEAHFGGLLLNGFLRLPYQWHLSRNSADLINAVQWRVYLGRNFFQPTLNIFNDLLMVSIMLISLFVIQPVVSFTVLIVLSSAACFIYKVIREKIDRTAKTSRNYQIAINKEAAMAIQGIKDVKVAGAENAFVLKYYDRAIPLSKIFGLQKMYADAPVLILETIGFFMLFLSICILLLVFDITTAYMIGTMALLAVTAWKVLPAASQILNSLSSIRNSIPFIQTLIEYVEQIESELDGKDNKDIRPLSFANAVKINNVSFAYEGNKADTLKNLDFLVRKGETVGIIGSSGAGKSTLVDLIIGLLGPIEGTINIDDQVLTPTVVPSWIKITGYVSQSSYIYDGTLAENIAFGIKEADVDRALIKDCCTMASMNEFVETLPEGIDTFIGERGVKLSGGQQQRVAIARALYRKPEILIFDEATSSLDTKNETSIQKTIYSFKGSQTLIIIAHRLSTLEKCDRVIWLEKGMVKMIGSPDKVISLYGKDQIENKGWLK